MRIRGGHIAGLAVGAVPAFVIYAALMQTGAPGAGPAGTGTEKGLTRQPPGTASHANPNAPGSGVTALERALQGVGTLPPMGVSDDFAARIEVETTHLRVGIVPNNDLSHHPLKVWNRGKVPLKISSIRTTCPCTQGHIANGTIPPGGEAVIDVVIDPFRISGFSSTKTLSIFSNDPKHGLIEVDVSVEIEPELELVPMAVDFGTVAKGATPSFTVVARQLAEEPPLLITRVSSLDRLLADQILDDLQLAVLPIPEEQWLDPAKNEAGIRITLSAEMPPGPFTRRINVSTNVPRLLGNPLIVEVTGEIEAPYAVEPVFPERLIIRAGDEGPPAVTVRGEGPVEILDAEFDPAKLAVTVRNEADASYLDVRAAPGAPAGRIEAELRFKVRAAGQTYTERVGVVRIFGV